VAFEDEIAIVCGGIRRQGALHQTDRQDGSADRLRPSVAEGSTA
jgi:hypothetical protein